MEELDEPLARVIRGRMRHPERTKVFSSREHNASRMTTLLRSLDLLVTSRYHAAVLSMAAAVPQVAVGHDLRLLTLYQELGMAGELFVSGGASPEVFTAVTERVERLLADPEPVRAGTAPRPPGPRRRRPAQPRAAPRVRPRPRLG